MVPVGPLTMSPPSLKTFEPYGIDPLCGPGSPTVNVPLLVKVAPSGIVTLTEQKVRLRCGTKRTVPLLPTPFGMFTPPVDVSQPMSSDWSAPIVPCTSPPRASTPNAPPPNVTLPELIRILPPTTVPVPLNADAVDSRL